MRFRFPLQLVICGALVLAFAGGLAAQTSSDLSTNQRLEIMRSKLEAMRRSLSSAISSIPASSNDKEKKNADDPRERLRGLDKEVASILTEVLDIRAKQERSDKYDHSIIDRLESSVTDINTRVEAGLQATAGARTNATVSTNTDKKKKKGKFLGLFGGGGDDKYEELTGTVAPGRDRVLFEEAVKEVRRGNHETGRLLFSTIINTYPDSPFLPLAKLAIADSFYLEGTTASLVQASQAYLDWLTFFPTDPLADDALLKVAEAEMRQMGLSDRDITHARKAEQRLKSLLQQYPQTNLRAVVEDHLRQTQESLGMHNLGVARFYYEARYNNGRGTGLKGAQSRLKEIVDKYPNFSLRDEVLFRLATTYQLEEEPDEAAKYYQDLLRNFPNSEYADKAKEQLSIIGAPVPEPDPSRRNVMPAEKQGFMGNLMQQVSGRADIDVDPDGILISKDKKEGATDLIDQAVKYNGTLPANTTPVAPVQRNTRPPTNNQSRPATTSPANATPASTPPPGIKP
ncbi:MAG TPA: outer membrane protein assembly factor BamD [Pyrinomonadaceae bacterium]|nr:outer membrane protein assembly factor BamD [Pyrinomonadaceae bacterium]